MYKVIAVTNRHLCSNDFLRQIKKITALNNITILLREKDLSEDDYETLAKEVLKINPNCILHSFIDTAKKLNVDKIHLPLNTFIKDPSITNKFKTIGVSIHSVEDAYLAEKLGASYITAGHIFATDCKKGVPPRGLKFLKEVCSSVNIPVYAIGGINPDNIETVINAGAYGVCMMSHFMK